MNPYEEARQLRVQENLRQLEGLGISKVSKDLLKVAKFQFKSLKCHTSPKSKEKHDMVELRRSSRTRNLVSSYRDEICYDDITYIQSYPRRKGPNAREYNGRMVSYEEQLCAVKKADKLQSDLKSGHPSFVKCMVRSHVSSCFWLGLPSKFCKEHLPPNELKMTLEDENGLEYNSMYIGNRTGLSGGWRGFAVDHNLEDGDVLVFELCAPDRFKVYIIKAIEESGEDNKSTLTQTQMLKTTAFVEETEAVNNGVILTDTDVKDTTALSEETEALTDNDLSASQKLPLSSGSTRRIKRAATRSPLC